jgi:hypothetical protein
VNWILGHEESFAVAVQPNAYRVFLFSFQFLSCFSLAAVSGFIPNKFGFQEFVKEMSASEMSFD